MDDGPVMRKFQSTLEAMVKFNAPGVSRLPSVVRGLYYPTTPTAHSTIGDSNLRPGSDSDRGAPHVQHPLPPLSRGIEAFASIHAFSFGDFASWVQKACIAEVVENIHGFERRIYIYMYMVPPSYLPFLGEVKEVFRAWG